MSTFSNKVSKGILVVIVSLIFCFFVIGCSDSNSGYANNNLSDCEKAMKVAAEVSDMQDTVEDIDPAIQACESLDEFKSASSKFPEALDGTDAELVVSNRCRYNPSLQDTAICISIEG